VPSVHVTHTWVYVRLEDFFILAIVLIWIIQFLGQIIKRKRSIPIKFSLSIFAYWFFGLLSLIFSLVFIGPHIANFFPSVAVLSYFRRIEYMSLFFVAFSTVKSVKDLRNYLIVLSVAIFAAALYGFGQRFYLDLWHAFPKFFEHNPFCFPSFQTGNEEFAKGIPLCLPAGARITSTFAGHYDLAAYLVMIIPIFLAILTTIKRISYKLIFALLTLSSITLLIFTASRISFVAYLLGSIAMFVFLKKKKYIVPLIAISIILLLTFSSSTAKRFMETFRFASVVTNNQGQVIGQSELPQDLKNRISKNILENIPSQNLPVGSGYLGLPQIGKQLTTGNAIVQSALSMEEARRLKLDNGGVEISTIAGSFLVKKVLVYDISFTTRFQAEWPNAWGAFLRNPFLGSGFATITLAADNDYLRALGESGLLGLFSFIFIFLLFYIVLKQTIPKIDNLYSKAYLIGIAGGIIGLAVNAVLIDVFEASKVAEIFWILFGIAFGIVYLYRQEFDFASNLKRIFISKPFLIFYLFFLLLVFYMNSTVNFFVADDFTWLKWAATSSVSSIPHYFTDSGGFFYRPIDKTVMFFLYTLFSFQPQGYHVFNLILHLLTGVGVYILAFKIFNKRLFAFIASFIFLSLPSQAENIYWISTLSGNLSTFFVVYLLIFWTNFRNSKSVINYVSAFIFAVLALLSYEGAIIVLPLLVLLDLFITKVRINSKTLLPYVPFAVISLFYPVMRLATHSVSFSGDYSYNLPHLVPNFIGNLLGYFGLMIFGEQSLGFYANARANLRAEFIFVVILLFIALILLSAIVYINRKKMVKLYESQKIKLALFFILFSFVSLIPFLGLGNIAERYSYLASIGFALLVALVLEKVSSILKSQKIFSFAVLFITFVLGVWYLYQVNLNNAEWKEAGRITNRTLAYIRLYHDGQHPNSNFYFVNTPIRKANAWIFPVGLEDGVWFIYRDESIKVYKIASIEQGRAILKNAKEQGKNFVFAFDKNDNIYEIK
jgi:O-antigen ligase